MNTFRRRIYHGLGEIWADVRFLFEHRTWIRTAMHRMLSPTFRERLMLAVTQVNQCRYCRTFHTGLALKAGIVRNELEALLSGQIPAGTPQAEIPALFYAIHWAENNAHPDPEAEKQLVELYGQEMAQAIHIALRMIRTGNLLGNTSDYVLYRLTFGQIGA